MKTQAKRRLNSLPNSVTFISWTSAFIVGILLSACGGGSSPSDAAPSSQSPTTLIVTADTTQVIAGDGIVTLSAKKTNTSDAVQWRLASGSPGSLDILSGDVIHYLPPAAGSISISIPATVTATVSGVSVDTVIDISAKTGLYLLAGDTVTAGAVDAIGSAARFFGPRGITRDSVGNFIVVEAGNHTVRKITPAGAVTTLAGQAGVSGFADGNGSAALFNTPVAVTADQSGNVYVADRGNHVIRKITQAGVVTTFIGNPNNPTILKSPSGLVSDPAGNIYVTDSSTNVVNKISVSGVMTVFAGTLNIRGSADGTGAAAKFSTPIGLGIDLQSNLYVADSLNNLIRKITPAGVVTTLAGNVQITGNADGIGALAQFDSPTRIAVDSSGNVFVANSGGLTIRKITPTGVVTTLAGNIRNGGNDDGQSSVARFSYPAGLVFDDAGNLYVADDTNNTIRKVTQTGLVTTFAGLPPNPGSTDGIGAAARFYLPNGIASDNLGNLYISDAGNNTIRKITLGGVTSTLAGTPKNPSSVDGLGAAAGFGTIEGIVFDNIGNLFIADYTNSIIRKATLSGNVTTFAGTASAIGTGGSADGAGASAGFNFPNGIALDLSGNLFIADEGNGTIRKITSSGIVTTMYGVAGGSSPFVSPSGLASDNQGNLFVTDTGTHTILKITATGVVTKIAGTGTAGNADGAGASAQFNNPNSITVDASGNLYIADTGNHTIRKIDGSGVVTTIAGSANKQGILLNSLPGGLSFPNGIRYIGAKTFAVTSGNSVLKLIIP